MAILSARAKQAYGFSYAFIPALIALIAALALPLGRPGREFFSFEEEFYLASLANFLYLLPLSAGLALILSFMPLRKRLRGDFLSFFAILGFVVLCYWLISSKIAFGLGALISLVALMSVAGYGLSEAGRIKSDAFVATSILLVGFFIALFVIYPLFSVLRSAVVVKGQFTFSQVINVLKSPLFLSMNNPYTPFNELLWIRIFSLFGAALGIALGYWQTRRWRGLLLGLSLGAIAGFLIGIMAFGSGAFPSSLLLAIIVSSISTLLGFAFAILGQRSRLKVIQHSLQAMSLLPIITPPFILAFSMIFLFGRRGLISHDILGFSSNALFGLWGVAAAQILAFTPVAYLVIRGSVNALDPSLEEASLTLGSSPSHLFRTITWPLLRPALANAFLLTVIESFADFGNPLILGGDKQYLAVEVFSALSARFNPNEAAVYGSVLLILVLIVFFAQRLWLGQSSFVTVSGKPSSGRFTPLPRWLEILLLMIFAIWTLLVLALYISIIYGSFVTLWGVNNTLTLKHYQDFSRLGLKVFLDTARIAAISAIPAALLGFLIAYLVVRQRFIGRAFVEFGSMLSFATPGTVMGIAYILAFNTGPWLLTNSLAIIVLAFIFRNMPVAIRGSVAGLAQIEPSLEEASTTLRANSSTTLRRILIPLLRYALLGGLIFAFVRGMTAISQVIFLVSPGNMLATVLLLGWVEQGTIEAGRSDGYSAHFLDAFSHLAFGTT
ncbi:MAG: iron ABC transporter permease [Deinococcales bacterium]